MNIIKTVDDLQIGDIIVWEPREDAKNTYAYGLLILKKDVWISTNNEYGIKDLCVIDERWDLNKRLGRTGESVNSVVNYWLNGSAAYYNIPYIIRSGVGIIKVMRESK